jgi:hypothetical protein
MISWRAARFGRRVGIGEDEAMWYGQWRWAAVVAIAVVAMPAVAQQTQRVVGTIEKVDGNDMVVKTAKGAEVKVTLAGKTTVTGVEKASMADVKPGSYVGSGAEPQPDGTQKAVEVHIFAPSQRGTGEGHRPWGGAKKGTMTNGTVGAAVTQVGAGKLTVKYKGGEQTIVVPPGTPIVRFEPGPRSELVAGAHISIVRATKKPDGTFEANRVSVGRGGVVPR